MTIINGTKEIIYWDGEPLFPMDFRYTNQKAPITINGVDLNMVTAHGFSYNGNIDFSKIDYLIIDNWKLIKSIKGPRLIYKTNDIYTLL